MVLGKELGRSEIQNVLGLKNRENFVLNYINPAIEQGYLTMMFPQSPNHPNQLYYLTEKGVEMKNLIYEQKMIEDSAPQIPNKLPTSTEQVPSNLPNKFKS